MLQNFPLKIVITGAESCGKTTLAQDLAQFYDIPYVNEYARQYLEQKNGQYHFEDLEIIAYGQIDQENHCLQTLSNLKKQILICDTDLLTIKIWSDEKFGRCATPLLNQIAQRHYDFYLLMSPENISWQYDPLRENPHDRERLTALYEENLKFFQKKYTLLRGGREQRLQKAKYIINQFLSNQI